MGVGRNRFIAPLREPGWIDWRNKAIAPYRLGLGPWECYFPGSRLRATLKPTI
jgi:hypothetical protein